MENIFMMNRIRLFRRRQYVIGSKFINYDGWHHIHMFDQFKLTLHPDLPITSVECQNNRAILLGYAIDPYNPELDDLSVLQRFVEGVVSIEKVIEKLETLSGRFVLAINCKSGTWLFHDACGLRQVYYHKDNNGNIWCASQPEVIAEHFGFEYDAEALAFRNIPEYRKSTEDFALINEKSPYKEIKYLLANHFLDLQTGIVNRYWPNPGCIGTLSVEESIEKVKPILQNSIKAAANRFNLKMGITAGCDSRKSLAASKEVRDKIYYFTLTPQKSNEMDLSVPSKLLPMLGLEHHKIDIETMSSEFEEIYRCSATWARDRHGHIAYTALKYFGDNATVLNSNISEYSQISYWLPKSHINGEGLAILKGLNDRLAIDDYQAWLDSAYPPCIAGNMNVLVLFQLELRSRWVANTFAELDIAYESFNPYNNRRLFRMELAVSERIRRGVHKLDYPKQIIKSMWPEALQLPINPERMIIRKIRKFIVANVIHKTVSPWLPIIEYLKYVHLKRVFKQQNM